MNKIRVWQEIEITEAGVGPIWRWMCPDCTWTRGYALYWDNAIRGVNYHIHWHEKENANGRI